MKAPDLSSFLPHCRPANIETKGEICEEDINRAGMDDRLNKLPDHLLIHFFSFLDVKQAVQTSILSKRWVLLWTRIPVLEFNHSDFNKLGDFDKFVGNVLCFRDQSIPLDSLTINRRAVCSPKFLKNVLDYTFSHDVKRLEVAIGESRNDTWPISLHTSSESLTHLKLLSKRSIRCPFLKPRPGSFRNLTNLFLKQALITDLELLSGFPVLKSLTLLECDIKTVDETLSVHALNLLEFTISCNQRFNCCELTKPRLRFLEYGGPDFPLFRTHECVPVLDTMVIGYNGDSHRRHEKRMFNDLLSLFSALPNVCKSLTLNSAILDILSLFPNELVKRSSPFRNLNDLKLDFRCSRYKPLFDQPRRWPYDYFSIPEDVKPYLLQNSPDGKVTMIYPTRWN